MSHLERAVVRHIARTAFHQTVDQHGRDSAFLEARRQANAFIADMQGQDGATLSKLGQDLDEILWELEGSHEAG